MADWGEGDCSSRHKAESIYLQAGDADSTSKGEQHKRGCVGRRAKEADIDILMETFERYP